MPLLLPPSGALGRRVAEPRSSHEYLQAIVRLAQDLTGPAREVAGNAVAAARELVAATEAIDKEVARLRKDVDSAETGRIEQRLAALGERTEGEGEERREMRELLTKHLDLARRLAARLQEKVALRARLADLLKELWRELARLRSQAEAGPSDSGRVRAVCTEVERHARAAASGGEGARATDVGEFPTLPR